MIDAILKKSVSDPHLARLAEEARDNAEVGLRHKRGFQVISLFFPAIVAV